MSNSYGITARPLDLTLHACQAEVFRCPARFRVLVAGRRFGKTHLALIEMLRAASRGPGRVVWYVGPDDGHSKRVAWERLKQLTKPFWAKRPLETEQRIELIWGSTLVVGGAFRPDSRRGEGIDFVVVDEVADQRPDTWVKVLRPSLSDRKGGALFIGTPKGHNHFYELAEHAKVTPNWSFFHFTTAQSGIVDQDELDALGHDLDEVTFRQEFEAEFSSISRNRVYRAFTKELNVRTLKFAEMCPLIWSIDFNVNPMCMLLIQKVEDMTHVLEEIIIKPDAYTELACKVFAERAMAYYKLVPSHQKPLIVKIYGDSSGNQHRTSGAETDWAIIKQFFKLHVGTLQPEYYIPASNPSVRDRVNCVNARLRNYWEESHLLIDPSCKELIRDLEEVAWALDSVGNPTTEMNKSDKARTHASDALGYFVAQAFSLKGKVGEKVDGRIF